jgi:GT2 family glycosyltransferase
MEYALGGGADYVWLLNNDTVVEMDTLGRLVDAGMSDETVGLISPVIYYYDDRQRIQFCGSYVDWNEWSFPSSKDLDSWERIKSTATVSLWGTALLIKSVVIERVGYLNEKYFAYEEDAEYCIRANLRGYGCVLESRARVYHKDSGSTGSRTAPIQLFLRRRNSYFFWMSNLKGIDKLIYFKSFLGTIVWLGSLRENRLNGSRDVYLDAAWSAMRDIGGSWEERVKMPGWLRRVFYCSFWLYPYWKGMKNRFSDIFKVLKRSSDTHC